MLIKLFFVERTQTGCGYLDLQKVKKKKALMGFVISILSESALLAFNYVIT